MNMDPEIPNTILVIEDNEEDFKVLERSFKEAGVEDNLKCCVDGDDALDYLHRRGKYNDENAPKPSIILLDLNLPGTDGRQVLKTIKSDFNLREIPVIVLTGSKTDKDVEDCYELGVNSYMQKPSYRYVSRVGK